jgi:nitrite reductase/ring-hydroxylating ferredoxin subunit
VPFIKVTTIDQLHEKRGKLVTVDGEDVVIFKRANDLFAINNVCAHQHFSMLHQGSVEEYEVACPMHGWVYDMRTGKSITGQGRVSSYKVKVVGEDVFIEFPDQI